MCASSPWAWSTPTRAKNKTAGRTAPAVQEIRRGGAGYSSPLAPPFVRRAAFIGKAALFFWEEGGKRAGGRRAPFWKRGPSFPPRPPHPPPENFYSGGCGGAGLPTPVHQCPSPGGAGGESCAAGGMNGKAGAPYRFFDGTADARCAVLPKRKDVSKVFAV